MIDGVLEFEDLVLVLHEVDGVGELIFSGERVTEGGMVGG